MDERRRLHIVIVLNVLSLVISIGLAIASTPIWFAIAGVWAVVLVSRLRQLQSLSR